MARSKAGGVRRPASAHPLVERIRIQGFKSIVDQTIELGCLNVIVGANGSGKTALLEAIGVLGAAADGRVDDGELLRRGVRPGVPERFKSAFADLKRPPRSIVLRAEGASGHYYAVGLDNPKDSPGTPWRFRAETLGHGTDTVLSRSLHGRDCWESKARKQELPPLDPFVGSSRVALPSGSRSPALDGLLERLRCFAIYDPQTPILRGIQADPLACRPIGLGGGRLAEALSEWVGSPLETSLTREIAALLEWTTSVSAGRSSWDLLSPSVPTTGTVVCFTDRFMRTELERLSAYDASEGTLHLLFGLMMALHPGSPRFFAIEGFGRALHPRLARSLVARLGELAIAQERQIIVTTHDSSVLDGLAIADDRIRLFAVDRTAAGHTRVTRVMHSEALERARESGLTMSRMWIEGLLGGVSPPRADR